MLNITAFHGGSAVVWCRWMWNWGSMPVTP